jgi:hypothetical protein
MNILDSRNSFYRWLWNHLGHQAYSEIVHPLYDHIAMSIWDHIGEQFSDQPLLDQLEEDHARR